MQTPLIPVQWSDFPEQFRVRIGERVGRQRLMIAEGQYLLLLHRTPKAHERQREGHLFWRNEAKEWKSNVFEPGISALFSHVNQYQMAFEKYEHLEEMAQSAGDYFTIIENK